jgi:hypothetical protein
VREARVHLALPKPSAFTRQKEPASASVVLQLRSGSALEQGQVNAIVHLVASSIPGLPPERVTVVDQSGRMLSNADPQGEDALGDYGKDWGEGNIHHRFCSRCGINLYGHGFIAEAGGAFLSVQVNTLDDASIDELVSGPVHYADGRNDNWMNPPADTRAM